MFDHFWVHEFPGAITVCDTQGIIIEMNAKSAEMFKESGGEKLLGTNVLDCHPEPSKTKMKQLLEQAQTNIYTIEKQGKKKLIYHSPWYHEGKYGGILELSMEIPAEIPNFVRE